MPQGPAPSVPPAEGPVGTGEGLPARRRPMELEERFFGGGGGGGSGGGGGGSGGGGALSSKEQSTASVEGFPVVAAPDAIAANIRNGLAEEPDVAIVLFLLRAEEGEPLVVAGVSGFVPPSPTSEGVGGDRVAARGEDAAAADAAAASLSFRTDWTMGVSLSRFAAVASPFPPAEGEGGKSLGAGAFLIERVPPEDRACLLPGAGSGGNIGASSGSLVMVEMDNGVASLRTWGHLLVQLLLLLVEFGTEFLKKHPPQEQKKAQQGRIPASDRGHHQERTDGASPVGGEEWTGDGEAGDVASPACGGRGGDGD